jgi:hypothetical protein
MMSTRHIVGILLCCTAVAAVSHHSLIQSCVF